jgi:hypothetical protein
MTGAAAPEKTSPWRMRRLTVSKNILEIGIDWVQSVK